jgi:hypothetical protein
MCAAPAPSEARSLRLGRRRRRVAAARPVPLRECVSLPRGPSSIPGAARRPRAIEQRRAAGLCGPFQRPPTSAAARPPSPGGAPRARAAVGRKRGRGGQNGGLVLVHHSAHSAGAVGRQHGRPARCWRAGWRASGLAGWRARAAGRTPGSRARGRARGPPARRAGRAGGRGRPGARAWRARGAADAWRAHGGRAGGRAGERCILARASGIEQPALDRARARPVRVRRRARAGVRAGPRTRGARTWAGWSASGQASEREGCSPCCAHAVQPQPAVSTVARASGLAQGDMQRNSLSNHRTANKSKNSFP